MPNEIEVFKHEKFGEVRIIDRNGKPWFVGNDIGGILRKGTIKEIQFPRRLFNVGGFIGDVMDYTLARAAVPNPVAALAGAIAFQAMLCGGKAAFHAEEETRSNCYIIILTGSTTGKNAPRKTNIEIINRIGEECARTEAQKKMVDAVIANSFASGQGIVSTIAASQSVLFQVDEMDKLLAQLSTNKDRQAREIERQLMEMYSSSTSIYYPDKRADKDKQPNPIEYPNLCVLGTATPGVFYDSLSFDSLRNGLVGRLIPMECKDKPTRLTLRDIQGRQGAAMLPQSVINTAWHWLRDDQDLFRQVKTVPYDSEVVDLLSEASQDIAYAAIDTAIEEYGPECAEATIWGRYNENRNKLILIRACSDNPLAPRITKETARWGIDLTEYSCRLLCEAVRGHVAENLFHRQMLKALDTIKTKGRDNPDGWVFFRDIHRALNRTTKETQDIFNALLEQEKIEIEEVTRGTKKTFRVRERLT